MGEKIKELGNEFSKPRTIYSSTDLSSPVRNSEQNDICPFCYKNQTLDHINDGTSECSDDGTLMLHG